MQCYETYQLGTWTTVTASGGGKSHQLNLYLYATQSQQYSLTTAVSPAGSGAVTLSPAGGWYNYGTQVQVSAAAYTGYQFTAFAGVDSSNGSTGYVTMNGNRSVSALFAQTVTSYTLTTGVSPSGSGTLSFSRPCCTYNVGTQVTIVSFR
jgi:hypothetical protein